MDEIAIEEKCERPRARHAAPKTRGFAVPLRGYVTANPLWDGGQVLTERGYDQKDTVRPVSLTLIGLATEIRPVVANLRMGSTAIARPLDRRTYRPVVNDRRVQRIGTARRHIAIRRPKQAYHAAPCFRYHACCCVGAVAQPTTPR